ncbi:MAG: hypothetical protein AAF413_01165 [Patescibacteria group bacterium]
MKYSLKKKSRAYTHLAPLAMFATLLLMFGVGGVLYVMYDVSRSTSVSITKGETSSQIVVVAGDQDFATEYFSFSADPGWQPVDNFTLAGKRYRYSQFDGDLVKRHLTIYVDDSSEREIDHVVAVAKNDDGLSIVQQASSHCSGQEKSDVTENKRVVDLNGVRFLCNVDGHLYSAAAGVVDGGIRIPHVSETDGQERTFVLFYEDVTFSPRPSYFENIIRSFEFK